MSLGYKGLVAAIISSLMNKRGKLQDDLRNIEKQAEELGVQQDDGRPNFGSARSKGGGLAANGQGKPKKGRTTSSARDGKRTRPSTSNEQDFNDEDDPDTSLR